MRQAHLAVVEKQLGDIWSFDRFEAAPSAASLVERESPVVRAVTSFMFAGGEPRAVISVLLLGVGCCIRYC